MFTWTAETTMRAIDRGVPEVAGKYNAAYRNAVRLLGPSGGAAHDAALEAVTRHYSQNERRIQQLRDEAYVEQLLNALVSEELD